MTSSPKLLPFDQVRKEYDDQATRYNALFQLPFGILETQLVASAIGSDGFCDGAHVLDLGGGTGVRALQALEAGAVQVDVVDISAEMMAVGRRDAETTLGREASAQRLRWFVGDASQPLFGSREGKGEGRGGIGIGITGLREPGSYDLVMANWIFDHVGSAEVLEAIWRNIAAALRAGGRFVGVRACDPRTETMISGKYGPTCQDFTELPGGLLVYSSTIPVPEDLGPPTQLDNMSLKVSYSGSTEMHEKHGFSDVEVEPYENADIVRADPEFWRLWGEKPGFAVVKARKT